MYYHLSHKADLNILNPFIPSCAISAFENITIPRVCFSTFIDGCLMALEPLCVANMPFYVYIPIDIADFKPVLPTVDLVRDSKYTKEVWSLEPVVVKCIGIIDVFSLKKKVNRNSGRGRVVEKWYNWKWVKNYI